MRTTLITGANRGIGLELVRSFAADGWNVQACCRNPDKAKALKAVEGQVEVHRADVTDGLRIASLARQLAELPIDLLINNAGIMGPTAGINEIDYDDWLEVMKVNALGPMRVASRFAELVAASERKLIVNVSSVLGSLARTESGGHYAYRSSKAALNMVTRGLAAELADRGITVVSLHPGWVRTDMGGEDASLGIDESVAGLRQVIERLTPADSGRFLSHDGTEIPW